MFRIVILAIATNFVSQGFALQCNQCTSNANATECLNPNQMNCSAAVSIATQSQLLGNYNFDIDITASSFKCMSLNSTFLINGFNQSLTVEGCVPQDLNVCNMTTYSYETEDKHSCATCSFDNCNSFDENGDIGLKCYQCSDEKSCKTPSTITCDLSTSIKTMQSLLQYYDFEFPIVSPNSSFSCFSMDTVFSSAIPGLTAPTIITKGCVLDGFQGCSLTPRSYLTFVIFIFVIHLKPLKLIMIK